MIKVAIIGTAGIPARYGGFETLAENLVVHQSDEVCYTIFCHSKLYPKRETNYLKAKIKYLPINANGISSILYDLVSELQALDADVLLVLGISASLFLPFIKLFFKKKIITNLDGLEWKRQKWGRASKVFLRLSEASAVRHSNTVIADNAAIVRHIANEYRRKAKLIEYGFALPSPGYKDAKAEKGANKNALCICRIEPENNIQAVLLAFARLEDWTITIYGNWNASVYGRSLKDEYEKREGCYLRNPEYSKSILENARADSIIYIHGHSAGGTNPSLVEAMGYGMPILAFDCEYNRETTEHKALYWDSSDQLRQLLREIDNDALDSMSLVMEEIANRRYQWASIAQKYEAEFGLRIN